MDTLKPTHYTDSYARLLPEGMRITAPQLFHLPFADYPKPLRYLLCLKDWIINPFHIQAKRSLKECCIGLYG